MKTHTQVVVIGGGVIGCSILYHLTKMGWKDVALLERKELTAGSTWHAAGGFHIINGDPSLVRLQKYTIELYKEIEKTTGESVGMHLLGGINLAASDSWWELLKNEVPKQKVMGIETHLVSPEEIKNLCPIVDVTGLKGGMYMADEGHIDPYSITHAYAKLAKQQGAEIYRHTKVDALTPRADGSWEVITNKGTIVAEHVVNAAGLWAREVGEMVGVQLPLLPFEHHYIITDTIPSLAESDRELLMLGDLDGEMYLRQEGNGVLLGVYETPATPWAEQGTPWDYGETDLLPNNLDRLYDFLEKGYARYPEVAEAGIKKVVNGPFTFSPDGNPLVGPINGIANYWVACGVMAGFAQGGGIGLTLAQWMIDGQPDGDTFGMDVARFGDYATKEYTRARSAEFYERRLQMSYPNEFWPAGRPARTTPLYETYKKDNAVFGAMDGLELPMYFAPPSEEPFETPTFKRSNAFPVVADECLAVREHAGLLDITGYGKYEVCGTDAEKWLNKILASKLPGKGRMRLAPMLDPTGRLMGDLTVTRIADDCFMLFGSGYLHRFHMRWFQSHIAKEKVNVKDLSNELCGLTISGPDSRSILQKISNISLANDEFTLLATQQVQLSGIPVTLARVSLTGELGYEIYVSPKDHLSLFKLLKSTAREMGKELKNCGIYAFLSLRLEKSYGIWSREFSADYTPMMCGLDKFIDYEKADFIGREAVLRDRDIDTPQKLFSFEVEAKDADVAGFEPIWHGKEIAGFTTSGGYGHTVNKSLAMGYLFSSYIDDNDEYEISILGERRSASLLKTPIYDPSGARMR